MRRAASIAIGVVLAVLGAGCAAPGGGTADSAAPDSAAATDSAVGSSDASTSASTADSGRAPAAGGDSTALVDIDWTLTELDGAPVSTAAGSTPTLRLTMESGALRATGLAGCNRFRGPATLADGELRFGPLVSTKMACPALDVETRYMRALDMVRSYRIASRQLQLLAGDRVVARLTAP